MNYSLLLAFLIALLITGCTSTMSEEDRLLWHGTTNAPATNQ
jgi:hypothetical protein